MFSHFREEKASQNSERELDANSDAQTETSESHSNRLKLGVNGQVKNMVLFNIIGRCWNFKEGWDGQEPDMDMTNVIWVKWGDP
jgi:hypothetical protein